MKTIPFILLLLLIISCEEDQSNRLIKEKNVHVELDSSQYFYLFEIEKHESPNNSKTVPFNGNFVHLTESGSMIAIDQHSFDINKALTEKLNDIYVDDIEFFHDTLLAEKDDELLYFDKSLQWKKYDPYLPIRYFDFLYEDSSYIISKGKYYLEFEDLYVYEKSNNEIYKMMAFNFNAVQKHNDKYFIIDLTKDYFENSFLYTFENFNEYSQYPLNYDSEKSFQTFMDSLEVYFPSSFSIKSSNYNLYIFHKDINRRRNRKNGSTVKSMLKVNSELYFIGNYLPDYVKYDHDRIYKFQNDTLLPIDTINHFFHKPLTVNYNDITTINENKEIFHFLRNDTLFKIEFVREELE